MKYSSQRYLGRTAKPCDVGAKPYDIGVKPSVFLYLMRQSELFLFLVVFLLVIGVSFVVMIC